MNHPAPKNGKTTDRRRIALVTPAKASANNGNWHTAARWQTFLADEYHVDVINDWSGSSHGAPVDAMIALHARRSADSIARFAQTGHPLAVVLTGTDLYRDIQHDEAARHSLELANLLVVLQAQGLEELDTPHRGKTMVIEQSAPAMPAALRSTDTFDLVMVGHMRMEKDPLTALRAMQHVSNDRIRLRHAGRTDDMQIGPQAIALAARDERIELLGPMDHESTRMLIAQSNLMLLPSLMEGGANVLIEAVMSQVPVLASRIGGSIGMLGEDYPGYFPVGDQTTLAALITRCAVDPVFLADLNAHCAQRAPLFEPGREASNVRLLAGRLFGQH